MSDDINLADSYQAAAQRLDSAIARLQAATSALEGKAQSITVLEQQRDGLMAERDRLSQELTRTRRRAEGLDTSAAEVSRRLVAAMETVKSVLAK